jgi:hypothetical protein
MPHLPIDSRVHQALLAGILRDGHPPYSEEMAARLQVDVPAVHASLHRLHRHHGLQLLPGTSLVWLIHPFSLSPTANWVSTGEKGWWAPCLWCAMGISVLAGGEAQVRTRLGGESEEICINVKGDELSEKLLVHFPLPPRVAWNNVIHWCASVQAFRDAASVERWCRRHGYGRPGRAGAAGPGADPGAPVVRAPPGPGLAEVDQPGGGGHLPRGRPHRLLLGAGNGRRALLAVVLRAGVRRAGARGSSTPEEV